MIGAVKKHLTEQILPFWKALKDEEHGGFYGKVDYDLNVYRDNEKGGILNSRILWFFSNSYLTLRDSDDIEYARHAYNQLVDKFIDKEYGGVYWSVTCDGKPLDTTKHTYCQAFAIYALSSFYDASKDEGALKLAYELYDLVESKCRDELGYLEAFKRNFEPESNEKLSENGVEAARTMNTLLHMYEAYTELYRVDGNPQVKERLLEMIDIIENKMYNPEVPRQEVFFDNEWNSLIDLHSYGHDIEAAWLIDRGLDVIGDEELTARISVITKALTECIYKKAYTDQGVWNEEECGVIDKRKIWWVQNEAVVGFINGYQRDNNKTEYLEAARSVWEFCEKFQIDKRSGSEWFGTLDVNNNPLVEEDVAGPWKCPYHNGRMCFEVIRRNIDA